MELSLTLVEGFHFRAETPNGITFSIDAHSESPQGPAPMQMLLASVPACAAMDIISILRKQRIEIAAFTAHARGERATEHPRVFRVIHLHFVLTSPNAEDHQLRRAIELSEEKYCSAWATLRASGCQISWTYEIRRQVEQSTTP
ncbi:MAG: osmotically inducible protein C [Candidatus Kapaibacterium sp.]|nr:MAG: osmotically inducible protein C [Candidatus Kapabacteria bacterium]GIV56587.1 MAG: osmotically inducible protein C [Candidatus Kapabacteria bacterium]